MFDNGGFQSAFLIYTVVLCVVPMVALAVGAFFAYRQGKSFLTTVINPTPETLQTMYDRLHERHPDRSLDELVNVVIRRQSLRCGAVGAITGIGGWVTLPIALPIDMVASYRMQTAMVGFIARAYNHDPFLPREEEMVASLVVFGSSHAATSGSKAVTTFATSVSGKALAKVVPVAGALIGFAVNYATTQAAGRLAAGVYSGRLKDTGGGALYGIRSFFRRPRLRQGDNIPTEE